jgi:tricorn protease
VALLVNVGTGCAAELFACYLRSAGRVTTIGSTTHGNLPAGLSYIVLPCGVVVRVTRGYVCNAEGVPIEGSGIAPDIHVEPTIDDFLAGRDPALDKAVEVLQAKLAEQE